MYHYTTFLCISIVFLLCSLSPSYAHTMLTSISTPTSNRDASCVRLINNNSPISSVTSPDMKCGFLPAGNNIASKSCAVTAGSKVSLQWNHETTQPTDDIIADSHKGPCLVYLSKDDGTTWFKIYEDGYNPSTNQWCVDTLIANKGVIDVTIPKDIADGNYLMRGEIIALHSAYDIGGAQPYVACAQLTISGGGSAVPQGVNFPGGYKDTDPGIHINIYQPITEYIIPGPKLYVAGSGGSSSGSSNAGGSVSGSSGSSGSSEGNIVSGGNGEGMSSEGAAALVIVLLFVNAVVVAGVFFYRKDKFASVKGFIAKAVGRKEKGTSDRRDNANYVAFTESADA